MKTVNPLLLVGAVIGVVTALLIFAYASVKDKKESMGFERNMSDGEIVRRLVQYAKPYGGKFALVGVLGLYLPLVGVAIAYAVIYYMALYDIFKSLDPGNCVLFLVLSIVFSVTEPFFLFFNRNKDGGMPPRRPDPVCIPPEPDWCDNSQDTGNTDFL